MADFTVRGAEKFAAVAKQLRDAGEGKKELQKELYSSINRAVKPLRQDLKDSMPKFLPDRYAAELAKTLRIKVNQRPRGAQGPSITLIGSSKTKRGASRDLASLNRGHLRHPLFRNRAHWYEQRVSSGWWDKPLKDGAKGVRKELVKTLDAFAKKLARRY